MASYFWSYGIWRDILMARYGTSLVISISVEESLAFVLFSLGGEGSLFLEVKLIILLTSSGMVYPQQFALTSLSPFGMIIGLGILPFASGFLNFFLSNHAFKFVQDIGRWEGEDWIWDLRWREPFLFDHEVDFSITFNLWLEVLDRGQRMMVVGDATRVMVFILCLLLTLLLSPVSFPRLADPYRFSPSIYLG